MSNSLRNLKAAVREFASRDLAEDIDPERLRDVIDLLEGELEWLYEPPADRARLRAEAAIEMQQAIAQMGIGPSRRPNG